MLIQTFLYLNYFVSFVSSLLSSFFYVYLIDVVSRCMAVDKLHIIGDFNLYLRELKIIDLADEEFLIVFYYFSNDFLYYELKLLI